MAINSPRTVEVLSVSIRRMALSLASDATMPVGGGAPTDAATLQGHSASYFAPASHTHALPSYDVAAEPAAAVGQLGKFIMVTEAALPTKVKICVLNSAGGYEWLVLGQSS